MRSILRVILSAVFVLNVFSVTFAQNTCNVTNYPRVGTPYPSSEHGTVTIENISVYSDQTGVLLSYTTGQSLGGISMASSTYILIKGEKHSIQAWGVLDSNGEFKELNFNEHYNVTPNTNYKFILFFPSIPVGIETVSIVEPNGFYWYGILINNSKTLVSSSKSSNSLGASSALRGSNSSTFISKKVNIDSKILETSYHLWKVISIEMTATKTILYERVTPIVKETMVYCDKTEYIEDVYTGKKYYLLYSDLGTPQSPTILYDDNPHNYTSTYPALPMSVEYINIYNGSTYIVKNLKIR